MGSLEINQKDERLLQIELASEKRATKVLKSFKQRNKFIAAGREENLEELYGYVLGPDLDELVELLDDDAEAIDEFVEDVLKKARPKG